MRDAFRMPSLFLLLAVLVCAPIWSAERAVGVKVLTEAQGPAAPTVRPLNARPTASVEAISATPQGRWPQYQLGRVARREPSDAERNDGRWRCLLALPEGPLLIEVNLSIDGRPYRQAREQRIDQLLVPPVDAVTVNPPRERIRDYETAKGAPVTREEVRWLVNHWIDGPPLMLLNDGFQRFRARQSPVLALLDRDQDGVLSKNELQSAAASLLAADRDRNELVAFSELPTLSTVGPIAVNPLIPVSPDGVDLRRLAAHYSATDQGTTAVNPRWDRQGDGQLDAEEQQALANGPPDLRIAVNFQTTGAEQSRLTVRESTEQFAPAVAAATEQGPQLTLRLLGAPVTFLAVQGPPADQIAIGAVEDGYPLLPELDLNADKRLTLRELAGATAHLLHADHNGDGQLSGAELRAPFRLVFSLGPLVHRELAGIRALPVSSRPSAIVAPEWFTRMDRNKDLDVSRREFPGDDTQFRQVDSDGDGLIDPTEAVNFDRRPPSGPSTDKPTDKPADKLTSPPAEDTP